MYIYKVMSQQDWDQSQNLEFIKPSNLDVASNFMHICGLEQIQTIIDKFWNHEPKLIIAKIDSTKVLGRLEYEANPGGTTKYYHLYDGSVPITAVVETEYRAKQRLKA